MNKSLPEIHRPNSTQSATYSEFSERAPRGGKVFEVGSTSGTFLGGDRQHERRAERAVEPSYGR